MSNTKSEVVFTTTIVLCQTCITLGDAIAGTGHRPCGVWECDRHQNRWTCAHHGDECDTERGNEAIRQWLRSHGEL